MGGRETRRYAFRRNFESFDVTLPSRTARADRAWCPRMVHAGWEIGCDPRWDVRVAKVQWKAPVEEHRQEPPQHFAEAPPWLRNLCPLTLSGVGVGCAVHPYSCTRVCASARARTCVCACHIHVAYPDRDRQVCLCVYVCANGYVFVRKREVGEIHLLSIYLPPISHPIRSPFVLLLVRGLSRPSKSISTPALISSSRILKCFSDSHFGNSQCLSPFLNPLSLM